MASVEKRGGRKAGEAKAKRVGKGKAGHQGQDDKPRRMTREALVKKAYEKVEEKLANPKESSKAIDDLVKLMKLEKDLGGEQKDVKEIKVRWEPSEDKSSSEG